MKYSLNQHYKFHNYFTVFLVYFMRGLIIFGIEIANIIVIVQSDSIADVIANFVVLTVIAQFGDFFYDQIPSNDLMKSQLENDEVREEIQKRFRIERTTSRASDEKDKLKEFVVVEDLEREEDGE